MLVSLLKTYYLVFTKYLLLSWSRTAGCLYCCWCCNLVFDESKRLWQILFRIFFFTCASGRFPPSNCQSLSKNDSIFPFSHFTNTREFWLISRTAVLIYLFIYSLVVQECFARNLFGYFASELYPYVIIMAIDILGMRSPILMSFIFYFFLLPLI